MSADLLTPAKTFQHMLGYLQQIGLDADAVARRAGLSGQRLRELQPDYSLPMVSYSTLYTEAARAMQQLDSAMPWAAGLGTDAFRFLCYSIIHCPTLGDALQRAEQFQRLLYPVSRNRIELRNHEGQVALHYHVDANASAAIFVPTNWDRTAHFDAVARASGLKIWYAFIGWLVGRIPDLQRVDIAAVSLSRDHETSLEDIFQCPVQFNADDTALYFASSFLEHRLIHGEESLAAFLENAIYALGASEARPSSTGQAVKSLLTRRGPAQMPGLDDMAEALHMSASSLRRRLQAEGNSYRQIKDEYRRDLAIRMLRDGKLKVHEIGEELGFLEPGSFIRSFKNWTGKTPKAFRNEIIALN